jgi:hypothetical protein
LKAQVRDLGLRYWYVRVTGDVYPAHLLLSR